MKNIEDGTSALQQFEEASITHGHASEIGDFKMCNNAYEVIVQATAFLKQISDLESLKVYFEHTEVGPRLWAAAYLLSVDGSGARAVLKKIVKGGGIHALTAETTLGEWEKGRLRL